MNTEFMVIETKNGNAFAHNAFIVSDESDFISRINAQYSRSDACAAGELDTVQACADYLSEATASRVEFLTQSEFDNIEGHDSAVIRCAQRAGWIEE